ncbi:hypothetical protein ACFPIK_17930 [Algoriphagus aquatilis]|uniref:Lipoprotein n=1 Tax=Algoriphagus aquatilis TaxID=490186 RepID=A0ABW0C152_9BACT
MKIKHLLLSLAFLITISCNFIEERNVTNESTLSRVLKDPLSKGFKDALVKTQESKAFFIGNISEFKSSRVNQFESIEDLKSFIQANYSNPDFVFNSLFELATIGQEIRNKYPEVSNFSTQDLEVLVSEILESRNNLNGSGISPNLRMQGQCEDERASSLQTCQDAALVGAAGCGLLTPTLWGALACGGFVYLGELACIDDANRSYDICKKYEK